MIMHISEILFHPHNSKMHSTIIQNLLILYEDERMNATIKNFEVNIIKLRNVENACHLWCDASISCNFKYIGEIGDNLRHTQLGQQLTDNKMNTCQLSYSQLQKKKISALQYASHSQNIKKTALY